MLRLSTLALALFIFWYIVFSIRRKSLKERYVAVWIPIGLIAVVIAVFPVSIRFAAKVFGFQVASNLLLLMAVVFLTIIVFQLTAAISRLETKLERVVVEIALMKDKIDNDS
ncbi:MAG: DUF2304 domain-containing protein [Actinomycetota bacterium]|nr:DUF2304 domain-containing protein [Actinomycetota bacterium]